MKLNSLFSTASFVALASEALAMVPLKAMTPFKAMTLHSGSPAHMRWVQAHDGFFWINSDSEGYCPQGKPKSLCPKPMYAEFVTQRKRLGLNVASPGGQKVYVGEQGRLAYAPHEHPLSHPSDARLGPFTRKTAPSSSSVDSSPLVYNGYDTFFACPLLPKSGMVDGKDLRTAMAFGWSPEYVIHVYVEDEYKRREECMEVGILTTDLTGTGDKPAAWLYS